MSAIKKTQLNSVAAVNHVCTILDTVAKLPFYIVLRAVLCCVNLNWVWGAYCLGVRWLLAHPVYISVGCWCISEIKSRGKLWNLAMWCCVGWNDIWILQRRLLRNNLMCRDQRSEVRAAKTVVSRWQQSAALSRRYCSDDSVRLIPKEEKDQKTAILSAHRRHVWLCAWSLWGGKRL